MALSVSTITAIMSAATAVVGLAEKYGPEVYKELVDAFKAVKSKQGPTTEQLQALEKTVDANDDAIQAVKD